MTFCLLLSCGFYCLVTHCALLVWKTLEFFIVDLVVFKQSDTIMSPFLRRKMASNTALKTRTSLRLALKRRLISSNCEIQPVELNQGQKNKRQKRNNSCKKLNSKVNLYSVDLCQKIFF